MTSANPIIDLTPATLTQMVQSRLAGLLHKDLDELSCLVRLTGRMSDPGQARGQTHFGVRITEDGGGESKVDLPAHLVVNLGLRAGRLIRVTGRLRVEMRYGMEVRLVAGGVDVLDEESVRRPVYAEPGGGRMTIEALKALPLARRPFPPIDAYPYKVMIVQSVSAHARVAQDCEGELQGLVADGYIEIFPVKINISDPLSIARAIHEARSDILIVIRGGGDAREFEVFDDPRVVATLAGNAAYRVTGLGHSGDSTLLDLVADFSASTPTKAGGHVRDAVLEGVRCRRAVEDAISHATSATLQTMGTGTADGLEEGNAVAWYWLVVAGGVIGTVLGWALSRLL